MLKRVLHAANQVVAHEETHTGKELVIENTVNAPSPSPEYPQDIISASGILKSTNNSLGGRDKLRESQITIPELRAIPGTDVRDELVVYEDGAGKIVRRVGASNLRGLGVNKLSSIDEYIIKNHGIKVASSNIFCTHFCTDGSLFVTKYGYISYTGEPYYQIRIKLENETAESITQFLSNNDVWIYYCLDTIIEEPLTVDEVQGILRAHQYHTEIGWEGLDEHLEPEVEVKCKVLGR